MADDTARGYGAEHFLNLPSRGLHGNAVIAKPIQFGFIRRFFRKRVPPRNLPHRRVERAVRNSDKGDSGKLGFERAKFRESRLKMKRGEISRLLKAFLVFDVDNP